MKIYPNKEKVTLYTRSMGKLLTITAIFESDDEANEHMKRHKDEGVIAVTGSLVLLANLYDKGQ